MLVTQLYGKFCFLTVAYSDYPGSEYCGYPVCVRIQHHNLALKTAPWLSQLQTLVVLSNPVSCWPFTVRTLPLAPPVHRRVIVLLELLFYKLIMIINLKSCLFYSTQNSPHQLTTYYCYTCMHLAQVINQWKLMCTKSWSGKGRFRFPCPFPAFPCALLC